mgnify:CR=1 FL=1
MSVLYVLVPVALALAAGAVFAYTWSSRSGQFDDLSTPALRAIFDDPPSRAGTARGERRADAGVRGALAREPGLTADDRPVSY